MLFNTISFGKSRAETQSVEHECQFYALHIIFYLIQLTGPLDQSFAGSRSYGLKTDLNFST